MGIRFEDEGERTKGSFHVVHTYVYMCIHTVYCIYLFILARYTAHKEKEKELWCYCFLENY